MWINNMVLPSPIGTWCRVEQWWQKVYTLNSQLEHGLLYPLPQTILNMYLHTSQKCWEWQLDNLNSKQDMRGAMVIKGFYQYKWPTYHSCHYCINAIKQYTWIAKIQITLHCNMANQSSFSSFVMFIISMTIDHWCCLVAFVVWNFNIWLHKLDTQKQYCRTVRL